MSSRPAPQHAADSLRRAARWTATPAGLATLFAAGLVLRLLLARGGGFPSDIAVFQGWAARMAEVGPGEFYSPDVFADYPPGYLYVLWPFGELARLMFDGVVPVFLVKLPAILADVALAYVVMRLASIVAAAAGVERWWVRPLAAAAILFNPPIVFLSAVWGQVDTVAAFYCLAGVLLLVKPDRSELSDAGGAALLALAFATKPQTAFVLPVVALALVVRHVRGRKADPADMAVRLGIPLVAFVVVWLGLAVPFGLGPARLVEFYGDAGSTYPWTSVWAFNLWGVAGFWRPDSGSEAFRLLGMTALTLGMVLFAVAAVYVLIRAYRALARRSQAEVILAGGGALVCLSFALLTRIHERYLFLGLACLAPLVVYPRIRAAYAALSALYMLNLFFPWVFYVEQAGRTTLKSQALFDLVYGTTQDSTQKKLLSLVTTIVCLALAARVWDLLRARRASGDEAAPEAAEPAPRSAPWKPGLRPIGRRGAALGAVVFLVVLPTRLVGLASPQEMYFDEIYHARTAGEYLQGRDAYEYTHPPLGKELMALSTQAVGRWRVEDAGDAPAGLETGVADSDGTATVWATPSPAGDAVLWTAAPAKGCELAPATQGLPLDVEPSAISVAPGGGAYVAGESRGRPVVVRYSPGGELWRARVDAPVVDLAAAGETVFAVDEAGTLWRVDSAGASTLAGGAAAVAPDPSFTGVWAAFPGQRTVSAYDAAGAVAGSVTTEEGADDLLVVPEADRVVTFDRETGLVETIDNQGRVWERSLDTSGETIAATPSQGIVYVVDGSRVDVVEPRALAFVGETTLPFEAAELLPSTPDGALMAVGEGGLVCVYGNNFFAWRLPGALLGALVPALVFLLALRCSGNVLVAVVAAALMALDGLAFAMSRIATLDSQVTAHVVAGWLAALSVWFHAHAVARGDRRGDRRAGLVWLGATGLFVGLAIATKWVGVYTFGAVALVMLVDVIARRERGVGALFPGRAAGVVGVGAAVVGLPVAVYLLSYVPYMSLGHSLGDVARLQKSMYDYHANLTAGHPYSSSWHGWPVGHKSVAMWTGTSGAETGVISAIANPVLFIGGLWGLVAAGVAAWRQRVLATAVLPIAALTQYVPWILVDRAAFLYHYLPVVPFLAVGLGWAVVARPWRRGRRDYEPWLVVAAAAAAFAFTLPELDGWYTSQQFHDTLHGWFPWLF